MRVSIVTPVYNDVRVAQALDSVFAQRYAGEVESVVIDAESDDGTQDVLAQYMPRLAVYVREPDAGIYDGMNKGLARATGDIIGILNADDRYADPDVLATVAAAFQRDPDVDVCYGNIVYMKQDGSLGEHWRSSPNRRLKWHLGWRPPHPSFFVRRNVYERYGAFVLDMPVAADYELQLRFLVMHGLRSQHIDRVFTYMAHGGASRRSFGAILQANLDCGRAWKRQGLRGGLLVPLLKPARSILRSVRGRS